MLPGPTFAAGWARQPRPVHPTGKPWLWPARSRSGDFWRDVWPNWREKYFFGNLSFPALAARLLSVLRQIGTNFAGQIRTVGPIKTVCKIRTTSMRFLVIVKATKDSEAGVMPSEQLLRDMGNFNEQLV